MFDFVRQVGAGAVACAAFDYLSGVSDRDAVLGIGVGEHPAFIHHVKVK